jgi:DNA mismatch endonuclease, patch repair protein
MEQEKKRRRSGPPEASSEAARNRMLAAKARDTEPELELRSALEEQGMIFQVDVRPGKETRRRADILFDDARLIVFVDGCFWHGCPIHGTWPKQNAEFWRNKIETNQRRDKETNERLTAAGWHVIRVWEHQDMNAAAKLIAHIVETRLNEDQC